MSSHNGIQYTAVPKPVATNNIELMHNPPDTKQQPVRWRISPRIPSAMLALFTAGVSVSVGHHLFYSRLDGSIVQIPNEGSRFLTQIWIIRYGTAFLFLAKLLLASTVIVAYKQHIWIDLQARANPISTIDAMFAATYDIFALLNPSLLLRAKLLALMACIIWYLFKPD